MNDQDKMVYRGDCDLVHIADGQRVVMGQRLADTLDFWMRREADPNSNWMKPTPLCPGCYMVAGFDMLVALAEQNGQSLSELGRTMAAAFRELEECKDYGLACRESIRVLIDPDDAAEPQAHGYVAEDRDSVPITHDDSPLVRSSPVTRSITTPMFDSLYGLDPNATITIDNSFLKESR